MELKDLEPISDTSKTSLNLSSGIHFFLSVDLNSAEEIFKLLTLSNSEDLESDVYGLSESNTPELKSWISEQVLKLDFYLLTDSLKQQLKIESIPWVTCLKDSQIIYSSSSIPDSLSFLKEVKPAEDPIENSVQPLQIPPVSTFSQVIEKQAEEELEKAMNKIKKLKVKVKEQEQIIEDYRVELRHLKALLEEKEKKEEVKEKDVKSPVKKESFSWNKPQTNLRPKFDEAEFWKVDDKDDYDDGLGFDNNVVTKDLWLMGILRSSHEANALVKGHVVLPPLNIERNKNSKSTLREEIKNNARRGKNVKNTFLSNKKLRK
jgi:hypothetical protein